MSRPLNTLALRLRHAAQDRHMRREASQIYRALLSADDHILLDIGVSREEIAQRLDPRRHASHPGRLVHLIVRLTDRKFS